MPIVRRVDESTRVLWTTIAGEVTADEVRAHFEAVRELQGQRYCEVIDTRAATPAFGARELRKLAEDGRALLAGTPMAPRAIVVNRHDLVYYGFAKLFASFAMPWVCMRVFDNLPAAVAYIEAVAASV
jgi:hypothetical protein